MNGNPMECSGSTIVPPCWLQDLSYKEKHWHEACFVCAKCRASLVDKQFGSKADRIYCGPCYDAQFATRCDGCGDVFRAGAFMKHDMINPRCIYDSYFTK